MTGTRTKGNGCSWKAKPPGSWNGPRRHWVTLLGAALLHFCLKRKCFNLWSFDGSGTTTSWWGSKSISSAGVRSVHSAAGFSCLLPCLGEGPHGHLSRDVTSRFWGEQASSGPLFWISSPGNTHTQPSYTRFNATGQILSSRESFGPSETQKAQTTWSHPRAGSVPGKLQGQEHFIAGWHFYNSLKARSAEQPLQSSSPVTAAQLINSITSKRASPYTSLLRQSCWDTSLKQTHWLQGEGGKGGEKGKGETE